MKNTAINKARANRLLHEKMLHFNDYVDELTNFQSEITDIAFDKKDGEFIRLDDAIVRLQAMAREKGLNNEPAFCKGIDSLRKADSELKICLAGKAGENRVSRTLEFVERENVHTFKNVYLTNEKYSTEIDSVVLTDSGIIILEVKSTKKDMIITEDGRLFNCDSQCYEKYPMGVKMGNKRSLLKEAIETELRNKGVELNIAVDSYIVFAGPKGVHINIDDYYKKEKFCRLGKLKYIIDDYESDVKYKSDEIELLKVILNDFETSQKGFEIKINYNEIFEDFLNMMNVMEKAESINDFETHMFTVSKEKRKHGMVAAGLLTGLSTVLAALVFSTVGAEKRVC